MTRSVSCMDFSLGDVIFGGVKMVDTARVSNTRAVFMGFLVYGQVAKLSDGHESLIKPISMHTTTVRIGIHNPAD